jgi:hypothetical protein
MKGKKMKRNSLLVILLFAAMLFFVGSCGRSADDASEQDDMTNDETDLGMQDQTTIQENQFWTYNRDYTFDQRNEFRDDVNAAVERLNDKITDLEESAATATVDTKEWYNDRIEELKDQRTEIQNEMQKFNKLTADNWNSFKSAITSTWNDIEHSWNQMVQDDRMQGDRRY